MSGPEPKRWMPAREALAQVMAAFDCDDWAAQRVLADRLESGAVTACADRIVKKRGDTSTEFEGVEVPQFVWADSTDPVKDRQRWIWPTGDFVVIKGDLVFEETYKLHGVRFDAEQVDKLAPPTPASPAAPAPQQVRDKEVAARLWDWEPVLIDLVIIADLDGLEAICGDLKIRGAQAKLEEWFASRFAELNNGEHPSETECRRRAQRIFAQHRAR